VKLDRKLKAKFSQKSKTFIFTATLHLPTDAKLLRLTAATASEAKKVV
jgi:hypothetical protein